MQFLKGSILSLVMCSVSINNLAGEINTIHIKFAVDEKSCDGLQAC